MTGQAPLPDGVETWLTLPEAAAVAREVAALEARGVKVNGSYADAEDPEPDGAW